MEVYNLLIRFTKVSNDGQWDAIQQSQDRKLLWVYGITMNYSQVYHPQENGTVEATNKAIVKNMWRNLEDKKGAWLEELPKVLWAQRTMKNIETDESPFALVFRMEAVLSTKVALPTLTTMVVENLEENQRQLTRNLDLLEEVRECTQIKRVAY